MYKYKLREILADWFKEWEGNFLDEEMFDDLLKRLEYKDSKKKKI